MTLPKSKGLRVQRREPRGAYRNDKAKPKQDEQPSSNRCHRGSPSQPTRALSALSAESADCKRRAPAAWRPNDQRSPAAVQDSSSGRLVQRLVRPPPATALPFPAEELVGVLLV